MGYPPKFPDLNPPKFPDPTHRAELVAFVARRAGLRVSAEDVVQLAATRAVASAAQLRDLDAGRAWLFQNTRRVLAEQLRRPPALDETALAVANERDESDAPFACDCVLANLQQLREDHASILRRVVLEARPLAEVAEGLGVSLNAATVRLHRSREALKHRMHAHFGTDSMRTCIDCACAERGGCIRQKETGL